MGTSRFFSHGPCLLNLLSGWQSCCWPADWQGYCFHFPSIKYCLGRKEKGKWERRGGEPSWEDLLLPDSVFIITAAVHRGNLASYIKGSFTAHLCHLTHIHTQEHRQHTLADSPVLSFLSAGRLHGKQRLVLRLKEVMFQTLLPKLLALGSEVCFYDCSGFCVNELKFHLSGAPCICQHILQIESCAGPASTHLSHKRLLIGCSPYNFSPQDREMERE